MTVRKTLFLTAAFFCSSHGEEVLASDTRSYRYDPLGRLVAASTSGGPLGSSSTTIVFDLAGNRSQYQSSNGSTPSPTPAAAPVARNPTVSLRSGASVSIALATLASTSTAANITGFTPQSGGGSSIIAGDRQSVTYTAPQMGTSGLCEPAETINYPASYSVQNASGSAAASGTATMRVTGPAGPRPKQGQQCP